jgi:hypothetical protein
VAGEEMGRRWLLVVLVVVVLAAGCAATLPGSDTSHQELMWQCERTGGRWIDDGFMRGCSSYRG